MKRRISIAMMKMPLSMKRSRTSLHRRETARVLPTEQRKTIS
jgi:hypothetical protein